MDENTTCQKCHTGIPADAIGCPQCGYEPSAQGKTLRSILYIVGGLLTISVIGAVIGIPMVLLAYLSEQKVKDRKPTNHAPA